MLERLLGLFGSGTGGDKQAETPAGGAAGGAAEGKSEADEGFGGGGIAAGAEGNTQAETPAGGAAGCVALPKPEADDGLAGGGTQAGPGGVSEAETLKTELISDAAKTGEIVSSPGNFFGRIVQACKAVEKMGIFKDAKKEKVRGVVDPNTILEGLLNCWKNASAEHNGSALDSCDTLIQWIRKENIVEMSKPESAKTLAKALQEMGAKTTAAHGRIVKACKVEAGKMEGTPEHIFKKATPRGSMPLDSLLECWKKAPADKKGSCYTLIQWIREHGIVEKSATHIPDRTQPQVKEESNAGKEETGASLTPLRGGSETGGPASADAPGNGSAKMEVDQGSVSQASASGEKTCAIPRANPPAPPSGDRSLPRKGGPASADAPGNGSAKMEVDQQGSVSQASASGEKTCAIPRANPPAPPSGDRSLPGKGGPASADAPGNGSAALKSTSSKDSKDSPAKSRDTVETKARGTGGPTCHDAHSNGGDMMEVDQDGGGCRGASSAVREDTAVPECVVVFMGMGRWGKDRDLRAELEGSYSSRDSEVWDSPDDLDLLGFGAESEPKNDQTRYFYRWRKYLSHVAKQFADGQTVIVPGQLMADKAKLCTWDNAYRIVLSDQDSQRQRDIWKKREAGRVRKLGPEEFKIQDVHRGSPPAGDSSGLFEPGQNRSIVRLVGGSPESPEDLGYLLSFRGDGDVKALCDRRDELQAAEVVEEAEAEKAEAAAEKAEEAGVDVEERGSCLTIEVVSSWHDFQSETVENAEQFTTFVQECRDTQQKTQQTTEKLFLVWRDGNPVEPRISVFDKLARCIKLLNVGGEGARAYNITMRFEEEVEEAPLKQEVEDASQNESDEWAQNWEDAGVHLAQVGVARRILERMRFILRCKDAGNGALICDAERDGFTKFQRLRFVVMLPKYVTLQDQTLARVKKLWRTAGDDVVFRYGAGSAKDEDGSAKGEEKSFNDFKKMVLNPEHAQTLFVMVDDECHCNMQAGKQHTLWLNDEELVGAGNLFQLLVSATPYSNLSTKSRVPHWTIDSAGEGGAIVRAEKGRGEKGEKREELNVVEWFGCGQKQQNDTGYLRFEDFLQTIWLDVKHGLVGLKDQAWSQLIRSDGALHSKMGEIPLKSNRVLLLIADYVFSFAYMSVVRCISTDGGWNQVQDITSLTTVGGDGSVTCVETVHFARGLSEQFAECVTEICDDLRKRKTFKAAKEVVECLNDFMWAVLDTGGEDFKGLDDEQKVQRLRAVIEAKLCDERRQFEEEQGAWGATNKVRRDPGQGVESFSETDRIVRDLISVDPETGTGRMKVVRVRNDTGAGGKSQASWLKDAFRLCRQRFFSHKKGKRSADAAQMQHFAVILDAGGTPLGLNGTLERSFYSRRTCMCGVDCKVPSHTLEGARNARVIAGLSAKPTWVGLSEKARAKLINEQKFNFEDLQSIPCVLILVEKGRMGDTFPHSMNCLDLRIRASDNMMTLVQ